MPRFKSLSMSWASWGDLFPRPFERIKGSTLPPPIAVGAASLSTRLVVRYQSGSRAYEFYPGDILLDHLKGCLRTQAEVALELYYRDGTYTLSCVFADSSPPQELRTFASREIAPRLAQDVESAASRKKDPT